LTKKLVLDESSQALLRVVGYAQPWEELAPGIRVKRRVVRLAGQAGLAVEDRERGVATRS
jgi:hypothetical protein